MSQVKKLLKALKNAAPKAHDSIVVTYIWFAVREFIEVQNDKNINAILGLADTMADEGEIPVPKTLIQDRFLSAPDDFTIHEDEDLDELEKELQAQGSSLEAFREELAERNEQRKKDHEVYKQEVEANLDDICKGIIKQYVSKHGAWSSQTEMLLLGKFKQRLLKYRQQLVKFRASAYSKANREEIKTEINIIDGFVAEHFGDLVKAA